MSSGEERLLDEALSALYAVRARASSKFWPDDARHIDKAIKVLQRIQDQGRTTE